MLLSLTFPLMGEQALFCQVERGKAASQEALPDELRDVDVKDYYIVCDSKAVGTIRTMAGHVVVADSDSNEAYFAAPGDAVFEKDVIYTLEASRCRVKFFDENLITMGDNTRIVIDELIDDKEIGEKRSAISILCGKAMCYVMRLFKYKSISFSVYTPTANIGVRGTKFGVEVNAEESASDPSYSGSVSPGDTVVTVVHCFEGEVEVYSPVDGTAQPLGAGESLELTMLGAGFVESTPPEVAEQFVSDTEGPSQQGEESVEGGASEQGESVDGEAAADKESGDGPGTAIEDLWGDVSDTVQTQTTMAVEEASLQGPARPTKHYGYFVGLLTKDDGSKQFNGAYRSQALQDFDSNTSAGAYYDGTWHFMVADGSADYDDPKINYLDTPSDGLITSGLPVSVQHAELGYNAYMEWGYWTQPSVMSEGSFDFYFDNRGYYVFGDYTTNNQMSDLAANNITGTYSGGAYGTYWTSAGDANMSGTFSTHVDFASKSISDFGLSVYGGGHSASISVASGTLSGSSSFAIDGATGIWEIDGETPDTKAAAGSVYGSNGEAIGGLWEMHKNDGHAGGMFQGTR